MFMASEKKLVDFNEYWDFLKREADTRGLSDADFMKCCNIPRQRYYEFTAKRNLTGHYMYLLMEGMGLTQKQIEEKSKRKFTEKQIRELKRESWLSAHKGIVDALIDNPELIKILEAQIELFKK
jgi:hypothetical protein